MTRFGLILLCLWRCLLGGLAWAEDAEPALEMESLVPDGEITYNWETGVAVATNAFVLRYQGATLTAQSGVLNTNTGVIAVEGAVNLQRDSMVWRGDQLQYNFYTREIETGEFRAGRSPLFMAGHGVSADVTNQVYVATNAFMTTDDVEQPGVRIQTSRLRISPGKFIEARHAVLYLGKVPVFYFPYLRRNLDRTSNHFSLTPGYGSRYGAYLLGAYQWYWSKRLSGALHLDYRVERGVGSGADVLYDAGRWGKGSVLGYYVYDQDPNGSTPTNAPTLDPERYRVSFMHQASPLTNLTAKVVLRKQSDAYVIHDFFETEYRQNTQPSSFLEVNRLWPNFSLNVLAQPQVNPFFETIERLPDVKLTAIRQQLGRTPFYYESDSSVGYYQHAYADTSTNLDFAAMRADTFHQVVVPHTFFGWLNVTPRVGGRFTFYGQTEGDAPELAEQSRGVFNTGAEVSFKSSRLWPGVRNRTFEMDGLRHIVQPSVNYSYVPEPNVRPPDLPQFDTELPSLRLLPLHFPDYNSIDSIDSQNVVRLGLRNKLQTKRREGVENVVNWELATDWRLNPDSDQSTFSDLYSDLDFKPRSWLTLNSELRYAPSDGRFRLANHTLTLTPNSTWSWSIGHRYLRGEDDPAAPSGYDLSGYNLLVNSFYFRLSDNWGARLSHHYELDDRIMQEQYYTLYRDFRSWTGALTFRVRDDVGEPTDYSVAFTFSFKAYPLYQMGDDVNKPSLLLGY
jgi:lipopolysaccharide assembly outer membrane protein LptD (OstA)